MKKHAIKPLKKNALGRRRMLRGVLAGAGVMLALPPLEAMFDGNGVAHADGTPLPVRFGTFFWGNGMRPDQWIPGREGAEWWRDPNEELRPIAESELIRDSVSVLTNFQCRQTGTAHHTGRAQMLTGTYDQNRGTYGNPTGPSVDYVIAEAWEGQTAVRSVDLGISRVGKSNSTAGGSTSFGPDGNRIGAEFSPGSLFDRVFGVPITPTGPSAESIARARQSMVDVVRGDAAALRSRLGIVDQRRLDEHLEGLRSIERAIDGFDVSRCMIPTRQDDIYSEDRGHELLADKNRIMADLMAMALACDVTRVFTYEFNGMQADTIFWQVGGVQGAHVQTHDDRAVSDADRLAPQYERIHLSVQFIMQSFTYLCEALARIPEGDSNLLHNSLIYGTSELADGTRHTYYDMPILLAGRAGGALRPGMHYRSPSRENTSNVPYTCMRALGLEVDGFGAGASRSDGVVSQVLAV
ncbi:MAG: DUF1552 domain-containing protein [Myxococcota bacterium]|nr:DUF1552 domain-containing protein [Myxococcota bacterium]